MKKSKILVLIITCIFLLQNVLSPVVYNAESIISEPSIQEENSIKTIEPGKESSLEVLAAEGKINEENYKIMKNHRDNAKKYATSEISFAKEIDSIISEYDSFEGLMQSEEGLEVVCSLLKEKESIDNIIKTPEDFDTFLLLNNGVNEILYGEEEHQDIILATASEVMLYIDKIIIKEDLTVNPDLTASIKGTWLQDDKVVLRWQHDEEWTPTYGYKLYRVIGDQAELIESQIGVDGKTDLMLESYAQANKNKITLSKVNSIEDNEAKTELYLGLKNLISNAEIDQKKLDKLGLKNKDEFSTFIKDNKSDIRELNVISGEETFKAKQSDSFLEMDLSMYSEEELTLNTVLTGKEVNEKILEEKTRPEIEPFQFDKEQNITNKQIITREAQLKEILNARNLIHAGSNVDINLSEALGLAFIDDVKEIRYKTDYVVYILLPIKEDTEAYKMESLAEKAINYAKAKGLLENKTEK